MFGQATPMRVLIADQQPNVRQALWLVCEQGLGLVVVAEAANTGTLLTLLKATHPDLLILEWGLPGLETPDLVRALLLDIPLTIIAVGAQQEDRIAALSAGVDYFVYKGDPPEKLFDILHSAMNAPPQRDIP